MSGLDCPFDGFGPGSVGWEIVQVPLQRSRRHGQCRELERTGFVKFGKRKWRGNIITVFSIRKFAPKRVLNNCSVSPALGKNLFAANTWV